MRTRCQHSFGLRSHTQIVLVFLQMKTYFFCKGKHCLQTCKDDKKPLKKSGKSGRRKAPDYSKSWWVTWWYNWTREIDFFRTPTRPVGQKKLFFVRLKNRKTYQDICSRLVHIRATKGINKLKINQSGLWTNTAVKSGKWREKGFFPPIKFRCSKKWELGFR